MFRFQAVFRNRFHLMQKRLLADPIVKTALITSVAVTYTHHTMTTSYCDAAFAIPAPKVVVEEEKPILIQQADLELAKEAEKGIFETLWNSLTHKAASTLRNIGTAVRYMERIFTYMIFGAPLVGLVPASYLLGNQIPEIENMTWGYLTWALQRLGPCFVKLAQWASTRPDLFPPKLIDHLETLQDKVTVLHPFSVIEKTLSEAFGEDWRDVLMLDPNPIGTGSVAQVFKGLLKQFNPQTHKEEMIEVAVKMIHPHVEKLIKVDMELFNHFANVLDMFPSLELLSLGESCREFSHVMKQQLDLRFEANHLLKFTKKFMNEKWAIFPKPIDGYITKNVLIETLMTGTPINYFMKLSDNISNKVNDLKLKLSDLGARLIIKMIFFDNYVHGDLHPGNVLVQVQPNGEPRLVILDCGIVYSSPSKAEHDKLVDICISFMKHDGYNAGKLMIENAVAKQISLQEEEKKQRQLKRERGGRVEAKELTEEQAAEEKHHADRNAKIMKEKIHNADEFCQGIQQIVIDSEHEHYFENIGKYLSQICELARTHVVRLDPGYFKIAMALKVAEGIALALDPQIELVQKCIPIVVKAQAMQKLGISKFPEPEDDEKFVEELENRRATFNSNHAKDASLPPSK